MKIGEKIKEQRLKEAWTQEQLAEKLTVSRSTVSSWEVGRNYPDLDTIVAISDLFGISLDKLLREDKEMTKKVSQKIKMNKVYKFLLAGLALLLIIGLGLNAKLRMDEHRYRQNLNAHGWQSFSNDELRPDKNQYELVETGTKYWTYILPVNTRPIPLAEDKVSVVAHRKNLVVNVNEQGQVEIILSKSEDPSAKVNAKVIVDKRAKPLESNPKWSKKKEQAVINYLAYHRQEYQTLITNTIKKREQIIG